MYERGWGFLCFGAFFFPFLGELDDYLSQNPKKDISRLWLLGILPTHFNIKSDTVLISRKRKQNEIRQPWNLDTCFVQIKALEVCGSSGSVTRISEDSRDKWWIIVSWGYCMLMQAQAERSTKKGALCGWEWQDIVCGKTPTNWPGHMHAVYAPFVGDGKCIGLQQLR